MSKVKAVLYLIPIILIVALIFVGIGATFLDGLMVCGITIAIVVASVLAAKGVQELI